MSASPEVFAAAHHHHGLGRNITPVVGKRPVLTDWRTRRATQQEIDAELAGRATGIGFVGGTSNDNIVPLDFDSEAGEAWWRSQCEAAGIDPDDWPTAISPGKKPKDGGQRRPGRHRYVHDVRGTLTNTAGRLKDLGIDVRGHGQVVMPPSPHPDGGIYEWVKNHSLDDFPDGIAPCPNFIYEAIEANPASGRTESQATRSKHGSDDSTYRYCRAVLDGERQRLAGIAIKRNNALNDAALALGHWAHHRAYTEDEARDALHAACEENGFIADHDLRAFEGTFLSGWRKGVSEPTEIPNMAKRLAIDSSFAASSPNQRSWDAVRVADGQMPPDPNTFTVEHWLTRDLTQPDYLLGDLATTTSRVLLIGPTGIGKTNLGLAIAFAMAAGSSFLHWAARHPARVLYIDGEMSARLMKDRLQDATGRQGSKPSTLWIINREDFPNLPPLNTEDGQKFVEWMIGQIGGVDVIIFDNIQSLLVGSHREDETWAPMLPWIRDLTRGKVGQLWLHHTGLATDRGYGDKTREWQFDTVVLMKAPETPTPGRLVEFRLEFTKARERTPSNRADFEPVRIWLDEDNMWRSSAIGIDTAGHGDRRKQPIPPETLRAFDFLKDTIADHGEPLSRPGLPRRLIATKVEHWRERLKQRGLYDGDDAGRQKFARAKARLIAERKITVDGDLVWVVPT